MNPINAIRSYFLLLKASALQGQSRFEEVVDIAFRAKKLHRKSRMAFLLLGEDLLRLNRTDVAKSTIEEALTFYPNDYLFNIWYAQILSKINEPIEKIIVHVQKYIDGKPETQDDYPFYMRVFVKPKRIDNLKNSINCVFEKYDLWAESIVRAYLEKLKAT